MERIVRMAWIALLFAFVAAGATSAQDEFEWALEEEYEFLEFHDPGYLVLKDSAGKPTELDFGYEGLPYDVVRAWGKGVKIRVAYSPERGTEVVDPETGTRYPLRAATPAIDELLRRCNERNGTTAGMSGCYEQAAAAWDIELNRAYQDLMRSGFSEETKQSIRTAQREWVGFRDASLAAMRAASAEKGGSIRALEAGALAVGLTRDQTLRLRAYLR